MSIAWFTDTAGEDAISWVCHGPFLSRTKSLPISEDVAMVLSICFVVALFLLALFLERRHRAILESSAAELGLKPEQNRWSLQPWRAHGTLRDRPVMLYVAVFSKYERRIALQLHLGAPSDGFYMRIVRAASWFEGDDLVKIGISGFDSRFEVYTNDKLRSLDVLTPEIIDDLLRIEKMTGGMRLLTVDERKLNFVTARARHNQEFKEQLRSIAQLLSVFADQIDRSGRAGLRKVL